MALAALYGLDLFGSAGHPPDGYSYYVYLPSAFIYHDLTLGNAGERMGTAARIRPDRTPPMAVHRALAEPPPDRHRRS